MSDDEITITAPSIIDIDSSCMNHDVHTWGPLVTDNISTVSIDTSNWNQPYTITSYDPSVNIGKSGIEVEEKCDIKIGDRSLKEFMDRVEERLNILHPNPALEGRWNELAELGKRYRELEAEILEKEKVWKILKDD